jgi:predicted nuclease with TOPRIM domain
MALKNKLINHIDKIKEIVLENELLKYAVKSLQKKLEEKNHNIQQLKVNSNTHHLKRLVNQHNNDNLNFKPSSQQKKIVHFNTAPPQQYQRRNIRNFVKNVQTSLESQRQPPKQSHPKIFIILKRKKFI